MNGLRMPKLSSPKRRENANSNYTLSPIYTRSIYNCYYAVLEVENAYMVCINNSLGFRVAIL